MSATPRGLPRWLELPVTAVALLLLSPVLAVVSALALAVQGPPVLHRAERAGRHDRPFTLYKVRTMRDLRGDDGALLPDSARLTGLGRFLRSTSLDELPQLWNVLRGDMALVGPRPLPPSYLDRYTPEERRRHAVRPGITGWAQVHGRNALSWDERLALDVWYVDHRSPLLDLRILVRTITLVLRRTGVSADGEATMAELRPDRGAGGR